MDAESTHVLLEYWGCDPLALATPRIIEEMMVEAAKAAQATIVKKFFQQFPAVPGSELAGITGVIIVAESHLSIHTWPEMGYAAVDVFTCGDCKPMEAHKVIKKRLKAFGVEGLTIIRGRGPSLSMRIQTSSAS